MDLRNISGAGKLFGMEVNLQFRANLSHNNVLGIGINTVMTLEGEACVQFAVQICYKEC